MIVVRVAVLLQIMFLVICGLTACWDLRDPENTGIVLGMGIDLNDRGDFEVLVQTINPSAVTGTGTTTGGRNGNTYHNRMESGETIFEAIRKLSAQSPYENFFSHNQIIVLSERLAKAGIIPITDFLKRNPQIRRNTWLLVAKGDLIKLFGSEEVASLSPSQTINRIINERDRNSQFAILRLGDFMEMLHNPDTDPYTAGVVYFKGIMSSSVVNGNESPSSGVGRERHRELKIQDTAIFSGDKLAGWFDSTESRGMLWVRGEVKSGVVVIEHKGSKMTLEILNAVSDIKPVINNGKITININIKSQVSLSDMTQPVNITNTDEFKQIEDLVSRAIMKEAMSSITKAMEYNADVFGFGEKIHNNYPGLWNDELGDQWKDIFPYIEVAVNVNSGIKRIGLITNTRFSER